MAQRQGIIADKTLRQHLLIAFPGLIGFGEVVGKIAADEAIPGNAGRLLGRPVDVGDLARRADGDQGIQADFDQAAGVSRNPPDFLFGLPPFGFPVHGIQGEGQVIGQGFQQGDFCLIEKSRGPGV